LLKNASGGGAVGMVKHWRPSHPWRSPVAGAGGAQLSRSVNRLPTCWPLEAFHALRIATCSVWSCAEMRQSPTRHGDDAGNGQAVITRRKRCCPCCGLRGLRSEFAVSGAVAQDLRSRSASRSAANLRLTPGIASALCTTRVTVTGCLSTQRRGAGFRWDGQRHLVISHRRNRADLAGQRLEAGRWIT